MTGLGFWAPGRPSAAALCSNQIDRGALEPACALLPPRLAGRASLLTRMLLEVAAQAGAAAQVDLGAVCTVFGSMRGEMGMTYALLKMLADDGQLSPIRFHNSVYNAGSGYFSIATGNRSFTTTVTAGADTAALALLEAFCVLEERPGTVLVAIGDEAMCLPFLERSDDPPMAAALCLTSERPATGARATLTAPRRSDPLATREEIAPELAGNPMSSVIPLLQALQGDRRGTIALSPAAGPGWQLELGPVG